MTEQADRAGEDGLREALTKLITRHVGAWIKESNPALQLVPVAADQDIRDLVEEILALAAPPSGNAGEQTGVSISWPVKGVPNTYNIVTVAPPQPVPDALREALENLSEEVSDNALWALASALHSNVPEEKRPMSWSDFSPEQIVRLHDAANAFLAALSSAPVPSGEEKK